MKWLFIFAHPDDETVASGATIKKLVDEGHEVILVSLTDGGAGEVMKKAQPRLKELRSVAALRKEEFEAVAKFYGVSEARILGFADGEVTNQMVWGKLTIACQELIDEVQPDAVVTFDHTGWYFHLDHVATSIAVTLAIHQATHQTPLFFHAPIVVVGSKWKYVFPKEVLVSHRVNATSLIHIKQQAFDLHTSQDTGTPEKWMTERDLYFELYNLVRANDKGLQMLETLPFFEKVD